MMSLISEKSPTAEAINKVLNNTQEGFKFNDVPVSRFVERLVDNNSQDISNNIFMSSVNAINKWQTKKHLKSQKRI